MVGVVSDLYSLDKIIETGYSFNIPIYQRLFVWTEEQVKTLFEDLHSAWISGKELYYVGGVITVPNEQQEQLFDLVDGQQRFTTLWLLANELKGDLRSFTHIKHKLRLQFSIRKNVEGYFNSLEEQATKEVKRESDFTDLIQISKARRLLISLIEERLNSTEDKKCFIQFLLKKVKLVISQVPEQTDLNKLFETLNNRGVQLQQHEILKARILKIIQNAKSRQQYAALWSVCSEMNDYLERAITKEIDSAKDVAAVYHKVHNNEGITGGLPVDDILELFHSLQRNEGNSVDLLKILKNPNDFVENSDTYVSELDFHPNAGDDELEPVRSILTFPQLLLHTLRIFLFENNREDIERINEKELLKTFDEHLLRNTTIPLNEKTVKEFMRLLFQVREVFDKYIIKWVTLNEEKEEHLIMAVRKQKQKKGSRSYYLRREKKESLNGFALLQSILYHSQQNTTQYWLTPILYWLVDEPNISFKDAFEWLRKLDNTILSSSREERSLPERTWDSMQDYLRYTPTLTVFEEDGTPKKSGTRFPHYWFYKVEFVLWYYKDKIGKETDWKDYKMTARNSIEHIGPQNPRYSEDKVCKEMSDAMGNLVLVTRSINSEYSDMSYQRKQSIFLDKKDKGNIDSLKSDLIYGNRSWNDEKALMHHREILELLKMYFDEHRIEL